MPDDDQPIADEEDEDSDDVCVGHVRIVTRRISCLRALIILVVVAGAWVPERLVRIVTLPTM